MAYLLLESGSKTLTEGGFGLLLEGPDDATASSPLVATDLASFTRDGIATVGSPLTVTDLASMTRDGSNDGSGDLSFTDLVSVGKDAVGGVGSLFSVTDSVQRTADRSAEAEDSLSLSHQPDMSQSQILDRSAIEVLFLTDAPIGIDSAVDLGRFRVGDRLTFQYVTEDVPPSPPVYKIDGNGGGVMSSTDGTTFTAWFQVELPLGKHTIFMDGKSAAKFTVIPGGDPAGPVISMAEFRSSQRSVILAQTASGQIFAGTNPHL